MHLEFQLESTLLEHGVAAGHKGEAMLLFFAGNQDLKLRTVELSRKKGSPLALLSGGGGAFATIQGLLQVGPC